ncbi:hypothetical protein [Caldalkalibacillus mannanilyticus]|uniref:hypothetical protein n=1 Tax=Caldalkalibacillus mannanilyticus TaxID=1418 RepID=UPI000468FE5B|nr:hypothetical protein [Caldalkalibacillus mannanilyticus]
MWKVDVTPTGFNVAKDPDHKTKEEKLEEFRRENEELKHAITEMEESYKIEKIEIQLAIAELAELLAGGGQSG